MDSHHNAYDKAKHRDEGLRCTHAKVSGRASAEPTEAQDTSHKGGNVVDTLHVTQ